MKSKFFSLNVLCSIFLGLFLLAQPQTSQNAMTPQTSPDDIVGTWLTEKGKAKVKIEKCDCEDNSSDCYCGKLSWLSDMNKLDSRNPKTSKRGKKLLNKQVLSNLKYNSGSQSWVGGIWYKYRNGKEYQCTLEFVSKNELKIVGTYEKNGQIKQTDETWTLSQNN